MGETAGDIGNQSREGQRENVDYQAAQSDASN
jgi:hypothetical protein